MNKEIPQQTPAEEPKTNTDLNSAPEKKSKKKLVLIILTAIVLLGGAAVAWNTTRKPAARPEAKTTTEEVTKTEKEAKVTTDPYAGWATFTGTCSGASFKYAPGWKVTYGDKTSENGCQLTKVTSPTGNILVWVPKYYGDGPGCDYSTSGGTNDCPTIQTLSVDELGKTGKMAGVSMLKQIVCNDAKKCEGRVALARLNIDGANADYPGYKVGTVKDYPLVVFGEYAFFITQGKQTSYGNPTQPIFNFTEASAKEWLNSADVNSAVLSMKSLSIK